MIKIQQLRPTFDYDESVRSKHIKPASQTNRKEAIASVFFSSSIHHMLGPCLPILHF